MNLGLLLFVVCFSGTIAVFSYEIDWLIEPELRVEERTDGVNWEAVRRGVHETYPYHGARFYEAPRHPGFAAIVYGDTPAGTPVKFYVHPQTGDVQARTNFWTVQRFFRSFHRRLFIPSDWGGILLVAAFSLVLLLSVTSGLLFYRNWRKNILRLRTDSLRIFLSDLHKTAGLWSFLVSFIFIVTGLWYGIEQIEPAPDPYPQRVASAQLAERGPTPSRVDWNRLVATARDSIDGFRPRAILEHGAVGIRGQADDLLVRDRANRVYLDPASGEAIHVQRPEDIGLYQRWSDTADPLHFGTFGGLPTQTLWFVFGLILSGLPLTGSYLWHRRYLRRSRSGDGPGWPRMSLALTAGVVLLSGWNGLAEVDRYRGADVQQPALADRTRVGPWTAELLAPTRGPDSASGESTEYRAMLFLTSRSDSARLVNYREIRIRSRGGDARSDPVADVVDVSGNASSPGRVEIESFKPGPRDSLGVEIETWDGAVYAANLAAWATDEASPAEPVRGKLTTGPPTVSPGVWTVVASFVALLLGVIALWLRRLARAT